MPLFVRVLLGLFTLFVWGLILIQFDKILPQTLSYDWAWLAIDIVISALAIACLYRLFKDSLPQAQTESQQV